MDNSVLLAQLYKGAPPLPGFIAIHEPEVLESLRFDYDLFRDRSHGCVARAPDKRLFSPDALQPRRNLCEACAAYGYDVID